MPDVVGIDQARELHEQAVWLKERDAFEAELLEENGRRLNATIVTAIKTRIGIYDQDLHLAIVRNLFVKFLRNREPFLAHFTGLRELPMNEASREQRLAAFDEILHHYLSGVLSEEVPIFGDEHPAATHTEKLNVI